MSPKSNLSDVCLVYSQEAPGLRKTAMIRRWKLLATITALGLGFLVVSAQISGADAPREASRAERARARTVAAHSSRAAEVARNGARRSPVEQRTPEREYGRGEFAGLGVSENQQAQIEAIQESEREQIREMRATVHDSTRRARWNAIRGEAEALIIQVLTPEQLRAREAAQERLRVARVNQQVERMTERLSLSTGQAARIRGILEQWDVDRDTAHRNNHDQEAALVRVREAAEAAMRNVLTPHQRIQLERMWEERAGG